MRFHRKKPKGTAKRRAAKKRELDEFVVRNMRMVRLEDGYCRVPACDRPRLLDTEVGHLQHRGSGGNPTGDRSDPAKMMLFCRCHHRTGRISIDAGTMRPVPLTSKGTRGKCAFEVDRHALTMSLAQLGALEPEWVEFARESAPHVVSWQDDDLVAAIMAIR